MNKTLIIRDEGTSVFSPRSFLIHLKNSHDNTLRIIDHLKRKILSGKEVTLKDWDTCMEALSLVSETLKSAPGIYQRTLPIHTLWDVTQLHDEVLFNMHSQYAFFVELFKSHNQAIWYFCVQSHCIVEVNNDVQCMRSYMFLGELPINVHIEDEKTPSPVAVFNGFSKAIQSGRTVLTSCAMRDCVLKN